jgi:hypothetical protein
MSTQTRNRAIILAMVAVAIVIGLIWPFALDNTKRMKDAEKAAQEGAAVPAER